MMRNLLLAAFAVLAGCSGAVERPCGQPMRLLNVSYDPTRELYREVNERFTAKWLADTGQNVTIQMSHGGSGSQARAVIDGLDADVVTLALAWDIDNIQTQRSSACRLRGSRVCPHNSSPYTSTIVFLVRKGNPKNMRDWPDLLAPTACRSSRRIRRPRAARAGTTSLRGATRSSVRSAATSASSTARRRTRWRERKREAEQFVGDLFRHVPVQDTGARAATNTFVQRGIGDVLLAWENEALLAAAADGSRRVRHRAAVGQRARGAARRARRRGRRSQGHALVAEAYLEYLYTPEGQDIVARNFFRPTDAAVVARYAEQFPAMRLFTVDDAFGGWEQAQKQHFNDGGIYDRICSPRQQASAR